jgi:hypothetical protein
VGQRERHLTLALFFPTQGKKGYLRMPIPHRWHEPWPFQGSMYLPFRYLSGRPLNGFRYSDATFRHAATDRVPPYHRLPGWKRFVYFRIAPPYLAVQWGHDGVTWVGRNMPVVLQSGWLTHESLWWNMSAHAQLATPVLAAAGLWKAFRGLRVREWRRERVEPLAAALAPLVGKVHIPGRTDWLTIPRSYLDDGGPAVEILLPVEYTGVGNARKVVVDTIVDRLGMGDVTAEWQMQGSAPRLLVQERAKPPATVGLADLHRLMEVAEEDAPVVGLGINSAPVTMNLQLDSPHLMVTGGSGGGKSVLVRAAVAHFLHHGARVVILDPKGDSHLWAKDLPGVTYAYRIEDLHDELIKLGAEQKRRADDAHHGRPVGQRIVVVAEEMNMATPGLRAYWVQIREPKEPKVSPALQARDNIAFAGRSLLMNMISVTQSATSRAYGGPEARENYGMNAMARQTARQWKMINEGLPMPVFTRHPGRWTFTCGGEVKLVQVVHLSDDEARSWSLSGVGVAADVWVDPWSGVATPDADTLEFNRVLTLREFAEKNNLPIKRVRKWSNQDPNFPKPEIPGSGRFGAQYDEAALGLYLITRSKLESSS